MIDISTFTLSRVLVVGDVMLDTYWQGPVLRISPEAPVPVVLIEQEEVRAGGAANVALNVAGLGAQTCLLGLAGADEAAGEVVRLVTHGGVLPQLLRVPGSKTIRKLRVLSRHQQLLRLDFEDGFLDWDPAVLFADFRSRVYDVDIVILSDYAKGVLRRCEDLIAAAREARKPVVVDPKGTDFGRYRGATVITPNLAEFEAVVGRCGSDAEIERRGADLRDALDLSAVLVTRSEKGMTLLARGHAPLHLPTRAQEVFDVTGAGDTVVASLAVAMAAGLSLPDAVRLSNVAAGQVVGKLGTATVTRPELQKALDVARDTSADRLDHPSYTAGGRQSRLVGNSSAEVHNK